ELVPLDAIYNARAVICLAEGDPAAALDVLRVLRDVTPPIDFPAFAFVEAHLLAGIAHLDLGDRNAAAAAAEAALAAAEPDRLIFPFAMTGSRELLDALPRHETAHGALLADIADVLRGAPAPSAEGEVLRPAPAGPVWVHHGLLTTPPPGWYTIRIKGRLGATALSAFPTMVPEVKGSDTVLNGWTCSVADPRRSRRPTWRLSRSLRCVKP